MTRAVTPDARPPAFLAPPFLRPVGLVALVALAGELLLFPRLIGLDAALWRAVLFARHCGVDRAVDRAVDVATWLAAAMLVAAVLLRLRRDGLRAVWPPLAVCLLGLHIGKLLKNAFARERPSMLPGTIVGHSFPSGHVMNTALAGIAVCVLAATFRHPRRWSSTALVLLTVIFLGRLLLAHHWFLDALGALLAALALSGLALPVVRRRPLLAPALLAGATTLLLATVTHHRALAIRLPSPLSPTSARVGVQVADARETGVLAGAWSRTADRFRRGSYLWLEGPGSVALTVPAEELNAAGGAGAAEWEASLAFGGRQDLRERRCLSMRVAVNGRDLPAFVPFVGWREYRLLIPRGTLRPGRNEVHFEVTDASGAPWRFAIAYVRVELGDRR